MASTTSPGAIVNSSSYVQVSEGLIVTSVPIFEAEDHVTEADSNTESDASLTDDEDHTPKPWNHGAPTLAKTDRNWWNLILQHDWVTRDNLYIYDPGSQAYIPMPTNRMEKKKALINLYIFLAKSVYFIYLACPFDWLPQVIPEDIFGSVLMQDEAEDLEKATFDQLHCDVLTRTKTVCEEWRLRYSFPKVPESGREVMAASMIEKRKERVAAMLAILESAGLKNTQRWTNYILQPLQGSIGIEESFSPSVVPERVFAKMINRVEFLFKETWTVGVSPIFPLLSSEKPRV